MKQARPPASVPRETLARLAERYGLDAGFTDACMALLDALAAEPDPHTTVFRPAEAADVHIADSLAGLELAELRDARRIADVGAGAGFPGLVLAAALPEARVDLLESAGRKVAVIERLAAAARLTGSGSGDAAPSRASTTDVGAADSRPARVRALPVRAEDWARGAGAGAYDAVTARAVAPLAVLAEYAAPLLVPGGALVAWKGARDPDEEAAGTRAAAELGLEPRPPLPVTPYAGSQNRHLHVYLKVRDTPERFPRRAGMAAKRPLG